MTRKHLFLNMLLGFAVSLSAGNIACAAISTVWETTIDAPSNVAKNVILGLQLTPDQNDLMVFHHTFSSLAPVEKINTSTGEIDWNRSVNVSRGMSWSGCVDSSGDIYLSSVWGGYTIDKYDSELQTKLWNPPYTGGSGFEYVQNMVTDDSNNVYAAGYTGSFSGAGSRCVKLDEDGNSIWEHVSSHTSGKDEYGKALALSPTGDVYRGGSDRPNPGNSYYSHGRVIGHSAVDGSEIFNEAIEETSSLVTGLLSDAESDLLVAYSHNLYGVSGNRTGLEQTVIQKRNQAGDVLWEHNFNLPGMYTSSNALKMYTDNTFLLTYQMREGSTEYPGVAEFSLGGDLLWMDTIDKPGWLASTGVETDGERIYMGLTNLADETQSQVVGFMPETPIVDILLDIKPGSDENPVNLKSKGVLPVSILSTDEFDALTVDLDSILFGDPLLIDGGTGVAPLRINEDDVNDDGLEDLMLFFSVWDMVNEYGVLGDMSEEAILTGSLLDGTPISGTDYLRIVPKSGGHMGGGKVMEAGLSSSDAAMLSSLDLGMNITAVPEPTSVTLVFLALAGLIFCGWRRR